jgi:hypothetical protein
MIGKGKIANWYKKGLWDKDQVAEAVACGELTTAEYEEIMGEAFPDEGEVSAEEALAEIQEVLA